MLVGRVRHDDADRPARLGIMEQQIAALPVRAQQRHRPAGQRLYAPPSGTCAHIRFERRQPRFQQADEVAQCFRSLPVERLRPAPPFLKIGVSDGRDREPPFDARRDRRVRHGCRSGHSPGQRQGGREDEPDEVAGDRPHQRHLQGRPHQTRKDLLVMRLDRDERGEEIAEPVDVRGLHLDREQHEQMAEHKLVGEADIEEEQELAPPFDRRIRQHRQFQDGDRDEVDDPCLDEGSEDLGRLIPLQRDQRRDEDAGKVPPVFDVHVTGVKRRQHEDHVGLGTGEDRAGQPLIKVGDAADPEICEFHEAEADDRPGKADRDDHREQSARQAGLPELVREQRDDHEAEALQVALPVEPGHAVGGELLRQGGQHVTVQRQAHCDADEDEAHEPVASEQGRPAPRPRLFREEPDDAIGEDRLDNDHARGDRLDDDQRHQIARHDEARQDPAEAQVEKAQHEHPDPDGRDDRTGKAAFREEGYRHGRRAARALTATAHRRRVRSRSFRAAVAA